MRLLILSHTANNDSGGEKSLLELVKDLTQKGHTIHVILPHEGEMAEYLKSIGTEYSVISFSYWVSTPTSPGLIDQYTKINTNALVNISNLVKLFKPDYCVTNTITTPWLAYAASLNNIKHIWCIREYGDLDHGLTFDIGLQETYYTICSLSDKIFANSKNIRANIAERTGLDKNSIGLLYPSVTLPDKHIGPSPFKSTGLKVVALGNIRNSKGQMEAVEGFNWAIRNGLKDSELLLVGAFSDDKYVERIVKYIKRHNLTNYISLVGQQKNPYKYLASADVSLVCSSMEAFGRVSVESMLAGTVVIGKNSAGTTEILSGEKGFLYNNIEELGNQLVLLQNRPSLLRDMSAHAREYAQKTFSVENCHKEFHRYINSSTVKNGLNLSPLNGLVDEINSLTHNDDITQQQLANTRLELSKILNSKRWQVVSKLAHIVRYGKTR